MGDIVDYWVDDGIKHSLTDWRGPAKLLAIEGNTFYVRHGMRVRTSTPTWTRPHVSMRDPDDPVHPTPPSLDSLLISRLCLPPSHPLSQRGLPPYHRLLDPSLAPLYPLIYLRRQSANVPPLLRNHLHATVPIGRSWQRSSPRSSQGMVPLISLLL